MRGRTCRIQCQAKQKGLFERDKKGFLRFLAIFLDDIFGKKESCFWEIDTRKIVFKSHREILNVLLVFSESHSSRKEEEDDRCHPVRIRDFIFFHERTFPERTEKDNFPPPPHFSHLHTFSQFCMPRFCYAYFEQKIFFFLASNRRWSYVCDGGSGSLLSWGGGGGGISRVFFSFPLLGMGCGWRWTP